MNSDGEQMDEELLKDAYSCDKESFDSEDCSDNIASGITFSKQTDETSQTYLNLIQALIEGNLTFIEKLHESEPEYRECIFY
jgi:hypothetical protein